MLSPAQVLPPQAAEAPTLASCSGLWGIEPPQCTASCGVGEIILDDDRGDMRNVVVSGEAVDIEHPRGGGDHGISLLEFYTSMDAELAAAPDRVLLPLDHHEAWNMWQRFPLVAGLAEFRNIVSRHDTRAKSQARARCFEAKFHKVPVGGSYGFVVHKLEAHDNVLVIDEIKLGGILDAWNLQMRKMGRSRLCVQRLAVIVRVNSFSDLHSVMTQELQKPRVILQIINPPTVSDAISIYDLLKEGDTFPALFWEAGDEEHSDLPTVATDSDRRRASEHMALDPDLPPMRQQFPEFSEANTGERQYCWRGKHRSCELAEQQVEDCAQQVSCGSHGASGGRRHNIF